MRKSQERSCAGIELTTSPARRAAVRPVSVRRITVAEVRDAYYHLWSTESYYDGDGSEYESRFLKWLESEKKKLSNEHSDYEKLVILLQGLEKRKSGESQENEYAAAQAREVDDASTSVCKETSPLPATKSKKRKLDESLENEYPTAQARGLDEASEMICKETQPRPAKKSKKRKIRDIIRDLEQSHEFKCLICTKSFTSHQALGGHMTAHRSARKARRISRPPAKR